jgi:hypothetical protein
VYPQNAFKYTEIFSISKKQISINEKPCCIILLELNIKLLLNKPINSASTSLMIQYNFIGQKKIKS